MILFKGFSKGARAAVVAVAALLCLPAYADKVAGTIDIEEAFVNLPVAVTEILPKTSRLDMVEYLHHDSIAPGRTHLDSFSKIVPPVTTDCMRVRVTNSSLLTLRKLKKQNGDEILAVLYTLDGDRQAPDTQVWFFTPSWKEIKNSSLLPRMGMSDFIDFSGLSKSERNALESSVPFPTVEFSFPGGGTRLEAQLTVGQFLSEEVFEKIKPLLRKRRLDWNGKKFILQPLSASSR